MQPKTNIRANKIFWMISRSLLFFLPLLLAAMWGTSYAENHIVTIQGTVFSDAKEPLIGVTIQIDNSKDGVISDAQGHYCIKVSKGEHKLKLTYVGYKEKEESIYADCDKRIDFFLSEDIVLIGNVRVVGESKNVKVKKSIFSTNAIDISSKLSSIQSITKEVEKGVGVRVRRSGGLGSDFNITLNGLGGNSIRYYIDGVPMNTKGEYFSLENIPLHIIDRIEVYKGVVPAYLGGDALGGAINIITTVKNKNYYDLSYSIGSFYTHQLDLNAQIIESKTGLTIKPTLAYKYSKNNYLMKNVRVLNPDNNHFEVGNYRRFHDAYSNLFSQLEIGFSNKSWADFFYFSASYSHLKKDIQTGATQDVVYGAAYRKSHAYSLRARYKKRDLLIDGLTLSADLSHTIQKSSTVDTVMAIYFWNGYRRSSDFAEINSYPLVRNYYRPYTTARLNIDYKLSPHSDLNLNYLLTANTDNMEQFTSDETKAKGKATDYLTRNFINLSYDLTLYEGKSRSTFFVKEFINHVKIEEKKVGSGAHYLSGYDKDKANTTKCFTAYGLGSRYSFHDAFATKLSYEYSVRLPGAMELLGDGDVLQANYALEPEKSNNYNLNIYGSSELIPHLNIFYEGGFFYRNIHDFIMVVQDREKYRFKNLSRISIKGVELEMGLNYQDQLSFKGNLSYEKAVDMMESKISDGKPNAAYRQQIPNRPTFYANLNASYTMKNILGKENRLTLTYDFHHVKWFYLTWATYGHRDSKSIIPTQNAHDVSATFLWHNNQYSVSLECNNIFDVLLFDNYKLQKPGRAIFCKFRFFFK